MRYKKEITILLALGALAAQSAAQQLSASVEAYAHVSGGIAAHDWSVLKTGQTSLSASATDAGPYVTANSLATAIPGLVSTSYGGVSQGNPYGSGFTSAYYRDAVRWTGTSPIRVKFRIQHTSTCFTTGSDAYQTSAGNYGYVALTGQGVNVTQYRQEASGSLPRTGFSDTVVTLLPGKWYTLITQVKASGDTSDSTKPYTQTTSDASSRLTTWFEPVDAPVPGKLEGYSGYSYTAPALPAVQVVALAKSLVNLGA